MGIIATTTSNNWNWDMIGPDLAVGAVTGVAVGLVLLGAQSVTQWRKSRTDSNFAWASLKPTVSGAAHRSWTLDFDGLFPIPLPLSELTEIAARSPLALWKSHMKKPDRALDSLLLFARLRPQFESCANEFESALRTESIPFLAAQNWMQAHWIFRILRARLYGDQDSAAYATFIDVGSSELPAYSAAADHLMTIPRIAAASARYTEAASLFLTTLTNLRQYLDAEEEALELH